MNISNDVSALYSVRQALGTANLRMAMKQDALSVASIINSLEELSAKNMELSVTPHKGSNIDLKV
jgi:hypothetical protein